MWIVHTHYREDGGGWSLFTGATREEAREHLIASQIERVGENYAHCWGEKEPQVDKQELAVLAAMRGLEDRDKAFLIACCTLPTDEEVREGAAPGGYWSSDEVALPDRGAAEAIEALSPRERLKLRPAARQLETEYRGRRERSKADYTQWLREHSEAAKGPIVFGVEAVDEMLLETFTIQYEEEQE